METVQTSKQLSMLPSAEMEASKGFTPNLCNEDDLSIKLAAIQLIAVEPDLLTELLDDVENEGGYAVCFRFTGVSSIGLPVTEIPRGWPQLALLRRLVFENINGVLGKNRLRVLKWQNPRVQIKHHVRVCKILGALRATQTYAAPSTYRNDPELARKIAEENIAVVNEKSAQIKELRRSRLDKLMAGTVVGGNSSYFEIVKAVEAKAFSLH